MGFSVINTKYIKSHQPIIKKYYLRISSSSNIFSKLLFLIMFLIAGLFFILFILIISIIAIIAIIFSLFLPKKSKNYKRTIYLILIILLSCQITTFTETVSTKNIEKVAYEFIDSLTNYDYFKNWSNAKLVYEKTYSTLNKNQQVHIFLIQDKHSTYLGYIAIATDKNTYSIQEFSIDYPPHLQNFQTIKEIAKEKLGNIKNNNFIYTAISQYIFSFSNNKGETINIDLRSLKIVKINHIATPSTPNQPSTINHQLSTINQFSLLTSQFPSFTYHHSSYATVIATLLTHWNNTCCKGIIKQENIIEKIPNYFFALEPEKSCVCEIPDTLKRYLYETEYEAETEEIKEDNLWESYKDQIDKNNPMLILIQDKIENRHLVIGKGYLVTPFGRFFIAQDQLFKNSDKKNQTGIYFYNFDGIYDKITLYRVNTPKRWQQK